MKTSITDLSIVLYFFWCSFIFLRILYSELSFPGVEEGVRWGRGRKCRFFLQMAIFNTVMSVLMHFFTFGPLLVYFFVTKLGTFRNIIVVVATGFRRKVLTSSSQSLVKEAVVEWIKRFGYGAEGRKFESRLGSAGGWQNCLCQPSNKWVPSFESGKIRQ